MLSDKNLTIFPVEELESLINSSIDVIFRISPTGKINFVSPSIKDLLNYEPKELIGKSISIALEQERLSENFQLVSRLFHHNKLISFNINLINKMGQSTPAEITGKVVNVGGKAMMQGTIRDIRKRIETLRLIESSENIFKAIWERSKDGMRLADENGIIEHCNESFALMFAKSKEEIIGKPISIVYDSAVEEIVINDYKENFRSRKVKDYFESSVPLWNDTQVFFEVSNSFIDNFKEKKYLLSIFRDISERKLNEELLNKKGRLLQGISKATSALISSQEADAGFNITLQILGESAAVDRVYIFKHIEDTDTGEMFFSMIYEWVAAGIKDQINDGNFKRISYSRFAPLRFYESFSNGNSLAFVIKDLPKENRDIFIDSSIRSIILVPIMIDSEYWGFIGFDECRSDRIWTSDEESILSAMAATLGAVIKRNQIAEQLLKKNVELDIAVKEAERATRVRSEFLALMSHEIRTPMNGVIGMTGLLMESLLTETQKEYVNTIRLSGEQLLVIINDILDFSKIESEKLELENQPFDLKDCIEDSLELVASKAAEKDIELIYRIENNTPPAIVGDITRLRQILTNLIGNAVKFTNNGEVELTVKALQVDHKKYTLEFNVRDTGIGIPEDRMDKLFKPFSQVDSSTTRSYGGTGLGLVISKKLIELMGGEIKVTSEINKGSNFNFTIESDSISSDKKLQTLTPSQLLKGKRVLIVDTNYCSGKIIHDLCSSWGLDADSAVDINVVYRNLEFVHDYDAIIINSSSLYSSLDDLVKKLIIKNVKKKIGFVILKYPSKSVSVKESSRAPIITILSKPLKRKMLHNSLLTALELSEDKTGKQYPADDANKIVLDKKLKLLLVEDNNVNKMVALRMLDRIGYKADIAANGKEAVEAATNINYDIILMDILMPEMDGLEACKIIKNDLGKEKLPVVIAMTANAMSEDRDNYLKAGMDDYISKPVNLDELKNVIEKWGKNLVAKKQVNIAEALSKEIDLAFIKEKNISFLSDLKGQEDLNFFKEMLEVYITELPKNSELIKKSILGNNPEHLRFYVHKLKGTFLTLGIQNVMNYFKLLEESALDQKITEETFKVYADLASKIEIILEELSILKEKYSNIEL